MHPEATTLKKQITNLTRTNKRIARELKTAEMTYADWEKSFMAQKKELEAAKRKIVLMKELLIETLQ